MFWRKKRLSLPRKMRLALNPIFSRAKLSWLCARIGVNPKPLTCTVPQCMRCQSLCACLFPFAHSPVARAGVEVRKVERKFEELRRVFVYLDRDNDGIISALDVKKRLVDLGKSAFTMLPSVRAPKFTKNTCTSARTNTHTGCKTTLKKAQTLMDEIKFTFGKGHNVKYPTLNLYNDRGELFGQRSPLQGRDHWAWAMKMHQPALPSKDEQQKSEFENWSLAGQSKASTEPSVVPERSWDSIGEADATNPVRCDWLVHPATHHMSMIQRWTENQSQHRILCPDSMDCSTRQDVQHPAALSPRKFLDMSPQNSTSESVEAVMLTESGLMTEKDWRAHIAMADADHHSGSGLSWVGLRDCFFKYLVDMGDEDPLPFFTIVEFLTFDRDGKGTASLEDCLSLIFKRFGPPSDTQFVKLFGNSANPGEQIRLPDYLDKVRRLMKMRQISKPSRGRTATAQFEANLQQNRSRRPGEVGQVQVLSL